jgi:hypothetical protein
MCILIYINKCNVQHLNSGFNAQSGWFDSCKYVDSSINLKCFAKPFKYNYKIFSSMCFGIL